MKFCDQPNVITVKASDMHQAKRSEELFRVVEGGVGGTFGLVDAGFKSTKLSKKMRTGDGISETLRGEAKVFHGPRKMVRISCKEECI